MQSRPKRYSGWVLVGLMIVVALVRAAQSPQSTPGLIVEEIVADSSAAKAGLKVGDRVLSYDGKPLPSPAALQAAAENTFGKEAVALGVRRGEETLTLTVPLGKLGIQVRPELPPAVLTLYEEGKAAQQAQKMDEVITKWTAAANGEQDVRELEPGKPIEREMKGGEAHSYRITLTSGQYLHVVVDQRGIDVVVTLFGPDGQQIGESDSRWVGPEPVSLMAEMSGTYRLEVRAREKEAASGHYEVRIEELRAGIPQDEIRVTAERVSTEGKELLVQGTAESRRRAIEKYEEALPLWRAVGDRAGEAQPLNSIGYIYKALGEKERALEYLTKALTLRRAIGNRGWEAETLTNIGGIYDDLGEKKKAMEYYEQALPLLRAVRDRAGEANTLISIGRVYGDLGTKQKALDYYNQALPLSRAVGDRSGEAATLINVGNIYYDLGERQKALEYYNQALSLVRAVGDRDSEAITLNLIGKIHDELGEKQKALEYYSQALPLVRAVGNRVGEAVTLNMVGRVYEDLREKRKALEYYVQALPLWRAEGDRDSEARTLTLIGWIHNALGEKQKALEYYNQALPLMRDVEDRGGRAEILNYIGRVYDDLEEYKKALDYYSQALTLWGAVGNHDREATALSNIGKVYSELGENQKALDHYNQSLQLSQAVGDQVGEAVVLNGIGLVYWSLGESQKALDYYSRALPLRRAVGDRQGEALTLQNIGLLYNSLGEQRKALDYYNQVLPLMQALEDRRGQATILNNIGRVYDDLGQPQKALDYYNQALPLSRAVGDRGREAAALSNVGNVYSLLGEKQKALDYYNEALALERAVGDRDGEASTFYSIGRVYDSLGDSQKALDNLGQALQLHQTVGDRRGEGETLHTIGRVYSSLGDRQKALDYYHRALLLEQAVGNRRREAYILTDLCNAYSFLGEPQKGLKYCEQALPLMRAGEDPRGEAHTLTNTGYTYCLLGELQKALEYFTQALPLIRNAGDREGEAIALNNIGVMSAASGEPWNALEYFTQALSLVQAIGVKGVEASSLGLIAIAQRNLGNLAEARARIEAAVSILESQRTKVRSDELRTSFFASKQSYYELYVDLLMRLHQQQPTQGHDAVALQASERARARSLLESLVEARADIRQGVDPHLLERERSLQQQLNGKEQYRMQLLSRQHTEEQAEAAKKELDALLTQYQEVQGQIRATSPRYAALTQPQPLSLKEIQQQVLDEDTLLLEYASGEEQSYLWAVTPTTPASFELPKRSEIEAAAKRVYESLTARNQWVKDETAEQRRARIAKAETEFPQTAAALSQMILGPVAGQLGTKRLLIVSDGALQYVPFAALPRPLSVVSGQWSEKEKSNGQRTTDNGQKPLIVDHEIVSLPSASVLAVQRKELAGRKPAAKTVAVLADPVFEKDDERVKAARVKAEAKAEQPAPQVSGERILTHEFEKSASETGVVDVRLRIPRLPYTREEANGILALAAKEARLKALDFTANRATATSHDVSQYRMVHFATHGLLNSQHPELSGIVLSLVNEKGEPQDGFLRLHDVYNMNLPAELVVLSACQTGLGKEIEGEGLVGLTRGFMYAGAARVVVSLWSVNDQATAELMEQFYKKMLKDGQRPAAALRQAQISMWKEKRWQSPYYWAAFVLQGEWR